MTELCLRILLPGLLAACLACSSQGWEEYMEAGYEAQQSGRLVEAEEMFLVAARYADGFGADDIRRAETLDNLADVYRTQQRDREAEGLYHQALEIRSQILGSQDQRVAVGLDNLARFYAEQGSYAAAEPLYWRAVEISEANLGPGHPDVATILGALAALYHDQHQYADAEPIYQRALSIREQSLGPNDMGVAEILVRPVIRVSI
jgi:tetratricopeptide (TPR) repeat protein